MLCPLTRQLAKRTVTVASLEREAWVSTITDVQLMTAIAGGDSSALGELYGRYAAAVMALGRKFNLGDDTLADVVHDVFLEVWERAADFDPQRGTVLAWIAVRLRSRCLDRKRTSSRRAELLEQHGERLRPRTPTPPGAAAIERTRLREAVARLDEDLREVTTLAYFDGASTSEIAATLQIAQGTVKSRMRRAREQLYQAMTGGAS